MEDVMSRKTLPEYIETQRARYAKATRAEKKGILTGGCALFGIHRKSLIRAFGRKKARKAKAPPRTRRYDPAELLGPLKRIWLAAEQPCGKRMKAVLPIWLPYYERHWGPLTAAVRQALEEASPSTLDRLLRSVRVRYKGKSGTRSVKRLEGQIPIRTNFRDVAGPGTVEADTVAHCGQSLAGAFVWSLTITDIWSGWTENRAVWNKSASQIATRLRDIEERLVFDITDFDSDNGGEFINHVLHRYFHDRATPVHVTRCRPGHKNDQAHVEQKQFTHVRALLGYGRLDDRKLVEMINDLYQNEWRALQNFFLPTMQLRAKTRQGAKIKRVHGKPVTPYARLMQSDKLSAEAKDRLQREFESYDPFELHQGLERKLAAILRRARQGRKGTAPSPRRHAPQSPRKGGAKTVVAA